jgi:hypothetical protein|tara:strand:- start:237 stop:692 length:456 start_codon:yes stop_codon:yes gene_type:complete
MTEKTITARSSFTMQYNPEFPNHLAAVHDDGHMNADGKLSHQPHKEGSIYFGEHDGESIDEAVRLYMALTGPLYIEGAKLHTHNEYTGTGDTSKSVWIESYDTDALEALDGKRLYFNAEQKLELIDGEWEQKAMTFKVRTNVYEAESTTKY